MIKFYKILFFSTLIVGTIITISSFSWMGMWLGLEINLLSIIPLLNNKNNVFTSEASLKYFITQALASTIFLFSLIMISNKSIFSFNSSDWMIISMNSSILTKMGTAPFHFWFPEVLEGLSWANCMILLTWQKIAPMVLIMYNINFPLFFMFIIILSMLISGILGINQVSLRKILAFSSINHMAWMISSIFVNQTIWIYYFIIYFIITMNIILVFWLLNIFYLKQLYISLNNNIMIKFFFILNFLSLGGLPPFLGFFPKWLVIQNLVKNNFILLALIMIILTLITLYYYMRITFKTLMINFNNINFKIDTNLNEYSILFINFLALLGLISCTFNFNWL